MYVHVLLIEFNIKCHGRTFTVFAVMKLINIYYNLREKKHKNELMYFAWQIQFYVQIFVLVISGGSEGLYFSALVF